MNDNKYRIIIIWLYDKYTVCWRSLLSIYILLLEVHVMVPVLTEERSVCVCVCVGGGGGGGEGGGKRTRRKTTERKMKRSEKRMKGYILTCVMHTGSE